MTSLAVIPARFGAVRFPGKPLARQTGKYLIQHVYERAAACPLFDRVVVATDDERIASAVRDFGGEPCMTRADHVSGTDRVAEVAEKLRAGDGDLVFNVQGDEPEVDPGDLAGLVRAMNEAGNGCEIGTLALPFDDEGPKTGRGSPEDPNCVKVVIDSRGRALYFSRSLIPYPRATGGAVDRPSRWLLHLGVYAFRAAALRRAVQAGAASSDALAPGAAFGSAHASVPLETCESLEQLRWLARGMAIRVVRAMNRSSGIDTPEDYAAFVARCTRQGA